MPIRPNLPVKGHGRNGASAFMGAESVTVRHETLQPRDACPACGAGKVYRQRAKDPGAYDRASASESDRVRDGALTMQWLRTVVHSG